MILLAVFLLAFAFGWVRAARRGAGIEDKIRYGLVHGVAIALLVFAVATIVDLPLISG